MTDLGAWAAERYRMPGSTITMEASLSDSLEGNDEAEAQRDS